MFSVRKIGSFILAFVLLIIGSILEGIVPKEIGRGIDSIQSGVSVNSTFSGILLLILMAFICSRIGLIGIKLLTVSAVGALRTYLYSFWNYKNYKKIDDIKKGEFTQIINDDLQNIENFTIESFVEILVTVIGFVIAAINIYLISPILFLSLSILYSTYFLPFTKLVKKQKMLHIKQREKKKFLKIFTQEYLTNKEKLYFLYSGSYIQKQVNSLSDKINELTVKINLSANQTKLLPRTIDSIGPGLIIILGGMKVISGEISIGELVSVITYLSYFSSPFKYTMTFISSIQEILISYSKVYHLIKRLKEEDPQEKPSKIYQIINLLNDNVHGYFLIKGKNGVGKSTLCKELYFNDLYFKKEYKMFVPQDFTFIKGTVEENLMRNDLSKFSKLLDIIPELNTNLSKENDLSTGQKAIINLIRQTNFEAQVIIIDELGANVDENVRKRIEEFFVEYFSDRCIFEVTHLEKGIVPSRIITDIIEV